APGIIAVLDQVSDPHNLGAIFRSAAAFGVGALVLQTRNAPEMTGTVAKSAVGAVETVPECRVVNISRSLEALADAGYHTVGLDGGGRADIRQAIFGAGRLAIVLGAEGPGLRPGVAKSCLELAHIPIDPNMESLNVSNAAAIAFYEAANAKTEL
ncbi:MAG: RNA methyltransferase, partial [Pseudomonadota bacterium]